MKKVIFSVLAISVAAGVLARPAPQPIAADGSSEARAVTTPRPSSDPAPIPVARPEEPLPSFAEQVRKFTGYSDEELAKEADSIDRKLDTGVLIARANAGIATESDRRELTSLLRERNAIYAVKTRRLADSIRD